MYVLYFFALLKKKKKHNDYDYYKTIKSINTESTSIAHLLIYLSGKHLNKG